MSDLESVAVCQLLEKPTPTIQLNEASQLAHWYTKTAVMLNVSQPIKLSWPAEQRFRAKTGAIPNASVHIYEAETFDLNWIQGGPLNATRDGGICDTCLMGLLSKIHHVAIQVGNFVGVVIFKPWQLSHATTDSHGALLWDGRAHEVTYEDIPRISTIHATAELLHLADNSFYRLPRTASCIHGASS